MLVPPVSLPLLPNVLRDGGAGLMNNFPCLLIRGISNYADAHQNKKWHAYTAGTVAACRKKMLSGIPPTEVTEARTVNETIEATSR